MDKFDKVICEISLKTDSKIVLLVIDGLGGLPLNGKTELEAAHTPNLDKLAEKSITGMTIPCAPGITPGSGPGHLALFGYDPFEYEIGRGVLEALGVDLTLTPRDVAIRGNFATVKDGKIIDRRAGRISTELNKKICKRLQDAIKEIDGVEIIIHHGKEHRFVLVLRGDGLDARVKETDPQKVGVPPIKCEPLVKEAEFTAKIIQKFIEKATKLLEPPANYPLLRGFAKYPDIPSMQEKYKLTPAAIATYPMYRGLARLVGMDILNTGPLLKDQIATLKANFEKYDFFYFHVKRTDSMGEDGNYDGKVALIEEVDKIIPEILSLNPSVFVVTADHSTPAILKSHSWHPNPFLLYSKYIIPDNTKRFTELECSKGYLGQFPQRFAMSLMLAHALKLKKYGA